MIITLLLLQSLANTVLGSCSVFEFESQPPVTLDCDPYFRGKSPPEWRLRIGCEVERVPPSTGSFEVHWFIKRETSNITENLGSLKTLSTNSPNKISSAYGFHMLDNSFHESMLGDVWCQIVDTSQTPNVYYGKSNVLTILHPDEYDSSLATCSEIRRNETETCADLPQTPNSVEPSSTDIDTQSTIISTISSTSSRTVVTVTTLPLSSSSLYTLTTTSVSISQFVPPVRSSFSSVNEPVITQFSTSSGDHTTDMSQTSDPTQIFVTSTTDAAAIELNSTLMLAASISATMLLLIILLLTIILVLLCTTNKKRQITNSSADPDINLQRQSNLRSSQRPLLESNSLSPDPPFMTSYKFTQGGDVASAANPTTNNHHYSVIRDSFQPTQTSAACCSSLQNLSIPMSNMIENQYYSTANETGLTASQQLNSTEITGYSEVHCEATVSDSCSYDNGYSSLKTGKSSTTAPNDGYNVLRQQKPINTSPNAQAYSTLYTPNIESPEESTSSPKTSIGPNALAQHEGNQPTVIFDDPNYSIIKANDVSKPTQTKNIPLKYTGNYERDPNYSIPLKATN